MATKKTEPAEVPAETYEVPAETNEAPQTLPQPEHPARGGRYRQDPVTGLLVVVPAIEEL